MMTITTSDTVTFRLIHEIDILKLDRLFDKWWVTTSLTILQRYHQAFDRFRIEGLNVRH